MRQVIHVREPLSLSPLSIQGQSAANPQPLHRGDGGESRLGSPSGCLAVPRGGRAAGISPAPGGPHERTPPPCAGRAPVLDAPFLFSSLRIALVNPQIAPGKPLCQSRNSLKADPLSASGFQVRGARAAGGGHPPGRRITNVFLRV